MRARSREALLAALLFVAPGSTADRFVPASTPILGRGESQPVAPNTKPDGTDDPDGRRLNRRVVVAIDTCG